MSLENKYAIALGVLCVLILAGGTLAAHFASRATPRTLRIVWPLMAMGTGAIFATFVYIARTQAH